MNNRVVIRGPVSLAGSVVVPGDKSITHRALILSAIASGEARLSNILTSADCLSTLESLRSLGVEIKREGSHVTVEGRGLYGLIEPEDIIDVGNSGTALRVLPSVLAAQSFFSVISGDRSIRGRPVDRIISPLSEMGARLWARADDSLPPLAIAGGRLQGIEYTMPVASAQVKTTVLLAGLLADGKTTVIEPVRSRDHTEIMLEFLGVPISIEPGPQGGRRITVEGGHQFQSRDISVPGDISSAAYFLASAVMSGETGVEVKDIGLNPTRTGFLDVLARMGAALKIHDKHEVAGEIIGSVTASKTKLAAVDIGGAIIPRVIDELPLLALLATQADGKTTVSDASELRVKETDRINMVVTELTKMGARITGTSGGFIVEGPTRLSGAIVDSHGDHRLAMMLAVAALVADGETTINGADAIDVSFPEFFDRLNDLRSEK